MTKHQYDWDFGFSGLARWFGKPWSHERTVAQTVADAASDRVGETPGSAASAILDDTLRLLESPLPTETITTLWHAATGWGYNLEGIDGRQWLRQVVDISTERMRQIDPIYTATVPAPAPSALTGSVMKELKAAEQELTESTKTLKDYEISGVAPALEALITRVDPNLGFRLFVRVLIAYRVPITDTQHVRIEKLGNHFGYGEFHFHGIEYQARSGTG